MENAPFVADQSGYAQARFALTGVLGADLRSVAKAG
jgi:hypothetical protein